MKLHQHTRIVVKFLTLTLYIFEGKLQTLLFSIRCKLIPTSLNPRNRPSLQNTGRTLRYKGIFARVHVRTTLRQNVFNIRAPRYYNNLPEKLIRIKDNKIFRKELTRFLISTRHDLQDPSP